MKDGQLSPAWILGAFLALIFCAEAALIYALDYFFPQIISRQARALVNAGALTLILSPFIWWLVARERTPALTGEAGAAQAAIGAAANAVMATGQHGSLESANPMAVMMSGHEALGAVGGSAAMPASEPGTREYVPTEDITQRKAAEERIRRLSKPDSVSGLADRSHFYGCLSEDIAAAEREHKEVALVYLSLARFRHVNPALGQGAGDRVLATVGERIRFQARRSDMVAEMADDEFAVIMANGASRRNAVEVSERIISALSKPFYLDGQKQSVQIAIGIGIALFPADAQDADGLVNAARAGIGPAK